MTSDREVGVLGALKFTGKNIVMIRAGDLFGDSLDNRCQTYAPCGRPLPVSGTRVNVHN